MVDNDVTNGAEALSVTFSCIPQDSINRDGTNLGDGSWLTPARKLGTLVLVPPPFYAGNFTVTMKGIALELSNGNVASSSLTFGVRVYPLPSPFLFLTKNTMLFANGAALLDLSVRMSDTRGTLAEEVPPEFIILILAGILTGVLVRAKKGARLVDNGAGSVTFVGSQAQAKALSLLSGPNTAATTGTVFSLSGLTKNDSSNLLAPVTDTFVLDVATPTFPGQFMPKSVLLRVSASLGNNILQGGSGIDTLKGGAGSD
jgi:Ca2+-binding RTX toxin-like protein